MCNAINPQMSHNFYDYIEVFLSLSERARAPAVCFLYYICDLVMAG